MNAKEFGKKGEKAVALWCEENLNYQILQMNYPCKDFGEIDIVAKDKEIFVFIEVKSRKSDYFMDISDSIDKRKKQALMNAALFYISKNNLYGKAYRIDAATYNLNNQSIDYYEDVFG